VSLTGLFELFNHYNLNLFLLDSAGSFEARQSGGEFYILENTNIVLPCGVKISPSQVLVHGWRKGKNRIPRQLINYSTLDLDLENVTPEDEGEYRCFVQTEFGTILGPVHTILNPGKLLSLTF